MNVWYLSPDEFSSSSDVPSQILDYEWVKKHPKSVKFTLAQLEVAFNHKQISDLGLIYIDRES